MSYAPDAFTPAIRFRDPGARLVDVPEHMRMHERIWREYQARLAEDSRPYSPMRSAWEVHGRLS